MGRYAVMHQTPAGATLTLINLTGGTTIRANIYDFMIGSDATPADFAGEFVICRSTSTGTIDGGGATLAENPLDPLTVAATAAGLGGTFGTPPTVGGPPVTTPLLMLGLNQRATFRWVAAPGSELITAATASNGIAVHSVGHGGTPNMNLTLYWFE